MSGFNALENYVIFRDCFSSVVLQKITLTDQTTKKQKVRRQRRNVCDDNPPGQVVNEGDDADRHVGGLVDFVQYLAFEVFAVLPQDLQKLSYSMTQRDPQIAAKYLGTDCSILSEFFIENVPGSVTDSLEAYDLLPPTTTLSKILSAVLADYINATSAPPPIWSNTRTSACEICARDWIPLTYHHLIPKQVHEKALKRNWHEEWRLNSVAWLCRACHSFVHNIASNEELAKDYWNVDLLLAREDVQNWARWATKVRWKTR